MKIKFKLNKGEWVTVEGQIITSLNKNNDTVIYLKHNNKKIKIQHDRMGIIDEIWNEITGKHYQHIKKWEIIESTEEEKKLFLNFLFGGLNIRNYDEINSSNDLYYINF